MWTLQSFQELHGVHDSEGNEFVLNNFIFRI